MKIYVYKHDRSEEGMTAPVIRRLRERDMWEADWPRADLVLIPGDRREAIRFALSVFELGVPIAHLGCARVSDRAFVSHYDHRYRMLIPLFADLPVALSEYPTMVDDLPDTSKRPSLGRYCFFAWNALPWEWEEIPFPAENLPMIAAAPGNDGDRIRVVRELRARGYEVLDTIPRQEYLRYMRHAESVWGNSSSLCYEAPIWHPDEKIHLLGKRNEGRELVRWTQPESPSDLLIERMLAWYESRCRDRG